MTTLNSLMQYTHIVADTGNLDEIRQWIPEEATTNPTLVLKAFQSESMDELIQEATALCGKGRGSQQIAAACSVVLAERILQIIPGRVSIEVDAHLSFDTETTVLAAQQIVAWAQHLGIDKRRILIKIASTWEGIQAAKILEGQGIACNCTLIFHAVQALACAQAGVTLISPFVGRIYDWYKAHNLWHEGEADPGVTSVTHIFNLLKSQGYATEIMGASFRNIDEILALVGCDRLTIAPKFLQQLQERTDPVSRRLVSPAPIKRMPEISEKDFRWQMNQDAMATEKLAEGIRLFSKDGEKLCECIEKSYTS